MTTPAQPESKTPISEEIRELRKQIISRFFKSGIIDAVLHENETDQLIADFVAKREAIRFGKKIFIHYPQEKTARLISNDTLGEIWGKLYDAGCAPPSGSHIEGVSMVCEEAIRLRAQAEADRREIESANAIKSAEKKILIKEIENHVVTKQALAAAQQRIKELEQDKSIVAWIEKASHRDILSLNACLFPSAGWDKQFGQEPEGRKRLRTRIIAAMSREPKEGEAK